MTEHPQTTRNLPADDPVMPGTFEQWALRVGYFPFHRTLAREAERFSETFGFDLGLEAAPPAGEQGLTVAFWISLPGWVGERTYALYGEVRGGNLAVTLGWAVRSDSGMRLEPYRSVAVLNDLRQLGSLNFSDWFRQLVRMRCDKV